MSMQHTTCNLLKVVAIWMLIQLLHWWHSLRDGGSTYNPSVAGLKYDYLKAGVVWFAPTWWLRKKLIASGSAVVRRPNVFGCVLSTSSIWKSCTIGDDIPPRLQFTPSIALGICCGVICLWTIWVSVWGGFWTYNQSKILVFPSPIGYKLHLLKFLY
jgi:hypothetical protein